jgi:pyruvate,water dikinase
MTLRIVELNEAADAACFGGKAHGLARLIGAGARVPEGFAVEACASPEDWSDAERQGFRRRVADLLSRAPVAVRSSAVGEDSSHRSFAGMFETVLAVSAVEEVLAAAARVIASGASDRVRAYTAGSARVGLVVQRQVAARVGGACFTIDPTGKGHAILIEAVVGSGARLVSGRALPERWRVYRNGRGSFEARRDRQSWASVLSEPDAIQIAAEASELARRFGHPLDLEWAMDLEALWWLQARPITASVRPPEILVERYFAEVDDGPISVWSNWNVREVMPDPFPPLAWTLWRDVILPAVAQPLFGVSRSSSLFQHIVFVDLVQGRLYWNMNGALAAPLYGHFFRKYLGALDARAGTVVERLVRAGVLTPRRLPGSRARVALSLVGSTLKSIAGMGGAFLPRTTLRRLGECGAEISRRPDLGRMSDAELIEEMRLLETPLSRPLRKGQQAMAGGFFVFALANRVFRDHPRALKLLTAGIAGNPTTEISIGIDELVEAARPLARRFAEPLPAGEILSRLANEPDGRAWLERLRSFLARFGHRCPNEFDLSVPRWAEDPTMILELVRAGLRSPPAETVAGRLERLGAERRQAVAEAVSRSPFWRRPLLRLLASQVEYYMPLREAPKHYAMLVFQRMRGAVLELGARWVDRGIVEAREDLFYLEWPELQALGRGESLTHRPLELSRARRVRFERFRSERAPDFWRSDGVPVEEESLPDPAADGALCGTGVAGGIACGPARILRQPDPKAIEQGDVLVLEFADPGWTPLFPLASAVVMEVGGAMCHAAVIARELGVPAVCGVRGATRALSDGQRVRVDGDRGTVTPENG